MSTHRSTNLVPKHTTWGVVGMAFVVGIIVGVTVATIVNAIIRALV